MDLPRFFDIDPEQLARLASSADPPVRSGERAEVTHRDRKVMLEAHADGTSVEWIEIMNGVA